MALEDGLTVASKGSQSLHIVLTIVSGNLQKFRDDVSGYDDSPQLALGDVIALLHVATALHCYLRTPFPGWNLSVTVRKQGKTSILVQLCAK